MNIKSINIIQLLFIISIGFGQNYDTTTYDGLMTIADSLYNKKDYKKAKIFYEKAQQKKPYDGLCVAKLKKIQDKYYIYTEDSIKAEKSLDLREFQNALNQYIDIAKRYPFEAYPKEQIKKIQNELLPRQQEGFKYIANGNKLFIEKNFSAAYEQNEIALTYKKYLPDTSVLNIFNQLNRCKTEEQKYIEENYNKFITNGDNFFKKEEYEMAIFYYNKAIEIKPDEVYPTKRILECNIKIKENETKKNQSEPDLKYDFKIKEADAYLAKKDYINAKKRYEEALALKPDERYPKNKIQDINKILENLTTQQIAYHKAIALSDSLFAIKDYQNALINYQNASKLNPLEIYPKEKIIEINNLIKNIKINESKYQATITLADKYYKLNDFEKAKTLYEDALILNPQAQYPKDRLTEIRKISGNLFSVDSAYNSAISSADSAFLNRNYKKAKEYYKKASEIKPNEQYPKNKIQKIEDFEDLITVADKYLDDKKYDEALKNYYEAMNFDMKQEYIWKKITEIKGYIEIRNSCIDIIREADSVLKKQNFDLSLIKYKNSKNCLEYFSKDEKNDIEKRINDNIQNIEKFNKFLIEAKNSFDEKDYELTTLFCDSASKIFYSQQIKDILNRIQNNKKIYNELIKKADSSLSLKEIDTAKYFYTKALEYKSKKEIYPLQKLDTIAKIINEYNKYLKLADEYYNKKEFIDAEIYFRKAQNFKDLDKSSQEKMNRIKTRSQFYDSLMTKASAALNRNAYFTAKTLYKQALDSVTSIQYTKNLNKALRLSDSLINDLLLKIKNAKNYYNKIKNTDDFFSNVAYLEWSEKFEEFYLKQPTEDIPKNRYIGKTHDGVNTEISFKKSAANYYIEILRYEKTGEKINVYNIYPVITKKFDKKHFFILKDNKYYIYKYKFTGNSLQLWKLYDNSVDAIKNPPFSNMIEDYPHPIDTLLYVGENKFNIFYPDIYAPKYYNSIVEKQIIIINKFNNLFDIANRSDIPVVSKSKLLEDNANELGANLTKITQFIAQLPRFDGSDMLRNEATKLFSIYQDIYSKEIKKELLPLMTEKKVTKEEKTQKDSILLRIINKRTDAEESFNLALKNFAEKYNIIFDTTEISNQLNALYDTIRQLTDKIFPLVEQVLSSNNRLFFTKQYELLKNQIFYSDSLIKNYPTKFASDNSLKSYSLILLKQYIIIFVPTIPTVSDTKIEKDLLTVKENFTKFYNLLSNNDYVDTSVKEIQDLKDYIKEYIKFLNESFNKKAMELAKRYKVTISLR